MSFNVNVWAFQNLKIFGKVSFIINEKHSHTHGHSENYRRITSLMLIKYSLTISASHFAASHVTVTYIEFDNL